MLDAANWRCSECGAYGNEVHHVDNLQHGGNPYDPANLTVLCKRCHILETYRHKDDQVEGKSDWINYLFALSRK